MATLFVKQDTDFRGGAAETNISDIVFDATDPNTIAIIAGFEPAQFGAGLISNTVAITGDGNTDLLQVTFSGAGSFSAAGWTFEDWDDSNQVQIFGTLDNQDITGSSERDFISGGGGVDHIDCGAGNDTIQIGSAGVAAGTTIEGGTQERGGVDTILLVQGGTRDLTLADISGVEELFFNSTGTTAIVAGDQIGAGGFSQIFVGFGKTVSLIARGGDVDLRGVTTFSNWGDDETITIEGASTLSNVLFGSSQNDTIHGTGSSSDLMTGGGGVDILTGGRGADNFRYFAGSELVAGEVIDGGLGADALSLFNAGAIDFRLATMSGVETVDFVSGDTAATFASSEIGLGSALAFISGSAGADRIVVETVGQAADLSNLGFNTWTDGVDKITINGSAAADTLVGTAFADRIDGLASADTMTGLGGNDVYIVNNVADVVVEAAGQGSSDFVAASVSYTLVAGVDAEALGTTASGGTAAIDLTGNEIVQTITGNAGANRLDGKGGADVMKGLGGADIYFVDNAADVVKEDAGAGSDRVLIALTYTLGTGVEVENFTTVSNGSTATIRLTGNEFSQSITGNAGNNVISGRLGNDTLNGLGGNDIFLFNTSLNSTTNVDRITDFSVTDDTIRLAATLFADIVGTGTLSAGQFVKNTTGLAADANDRIIYETDTGKLFYDLNGNAAGGSFHFATLTPNLALTNADFDVV